jgi:uncharacterized protein
MAALASRDFRVDLLTLPRRPGAHKALTLDPVVPEDWGGGLIRVPAGSALRLDLTLESVGEGVLVTGQADFILAGQCARCLDPISRRGQATLQELFVDPSRAQADDLALIEADTIDLEPVVRDAIVIDLPLAPLCDDDCAGLCAQCGANLNREPAHHHGVSADARWSGLADWVPSQSEVAG